MGLFDFSASSSESSSRSDSRSFDNLDSFGFNRGGSQASSRIAFEDVFQNLFGNASGAAGGVDTGAISRSASMLFSSGMGFLDDLSGGGAGTSYLEGQLGAGSSIGDEQIAQLSTDLGDFLSNTINPAIKSSGVSAGTLGGSRGEVARGLAAEGATKEFVRGSREIRAGEQGRLDAIAGGLAGNELQRAQGGIGALPGLFGLAESSNLAGLSPYLALSQILGGPTVLSDSSAFDVGIDSTTGRAASTSSSRSSSSSNSFGFGFS